MKMTDMNIMSFGHVHIPVRHLVAGGGSCSYFNAACSRGAPRCPLVTRSCSSRPYLAVTSQYTAAAHFPAPRITAVDRITRSSLLAVEYKNKNALTSLNHLGP